MQPGSSFSDVDAAPAPDGCAAYLERLSGWAPVAAAKVARDALLELRPGDRALEAGCGLGDDARRLAGLVGPEGEVVGLDASAVLLARAAARGGGVRWVRGDAQALPFGDGVFDAARMERTLQHLADPPRAVQELARVVRPGGVVVCCEPDWGSLAISGMAPDVDAALRQALRTGIRHAWVGRELHGLLAAAGLTDVAVRADALVLRDADVLATGGDVGHGLGAAVDAGLLDPATAAGEQARLHRAVAEGSLTGLLVLVTAWGRR
ncbi:MAG TPA: methyltransferase domain-containing protein [Baekduia sp.]|nr:methyltransferase domain-containing protein [Baekduia sp.]